LQRCCYFSQPSRWSAPWRKAPRRRRQPKERQRRRTRPRQPCRPTPRNPQRRGPPPKVAPHDGMVMPADVVLGLRYTTCRLGTAGPHLTTINTATMVDLFTDHVGGFGGTVSGGDVRKPPPPCGTELRNAAGRRATKAVTGARPAVRVLLADRSLKLTAKVGGVSRPPPHGDAAVIVP